MTRVGWFWLTITVVVAVSLWRLADILLPFVAGMAIAYLLDPVVDVLERRRIPRLLSTVLVVIAFLGVVGLFALLLLPLFQTQSVDLITRLPQVAVVLGDRIDAFLVRIQTDLGVPTEELRSMRETIGAQQTRIIELIGNLMRGLLTSGLAIVNLLSLIFITPVVAFYLLRDWDVMVATVDGWLPRAHADVLRAQAIEIDRTLAGFARGQALLCLSLGAFYAIALSIAGLQFGFVIGVVTGILSFIPYVGTLTGAALSLGFAALQYDTFGPIALIAAIYGVGQVIEGNIMQPLLVGDRVGLHPVWVIFALLAGGSLMGFVGILVAIPVAAVAGVVLRFLLRRYLESPFFLGRDERPG